MGKDNNDETKTVTKQEPWGPIQPYLTAAMADAQNMYKAGAPQYYPGQTIAPMSSYSKNGLDALAQRAANGSPVSTAGQNQLMNTLNGTYLNAGNPAFQGALSAATRPMIQAYNDQIMPGIDSNFSSAGRYGSGAHAMATGDAANALMNNIGDVSSQMAYQNYGDERQRQMQSMLFAPEMAAQDYKDIMALQDAGKGYDQYNQSLIDANMQKYDYNVNSPYNWLSNYIGLLGGVPGPSQTSNAKTPRPSTLEQIGGYIIGNASQAAKAYAGG